MGRGVPLALTTAALLGAWPGPAAGASAAGALERAERLMRDGDARELTGALLELRRARLTPEQRSRAQRLSARPGYQVPEAAPACGPRVCVHWVAAGDDAPPIDDRDGDATPDHVEDTLAAWEQAIDFQASEAGGAWPPFKGDGDELDVYVKQLGGGAYVHTDDPDSTSPSIHAYAVVDDDFAEYAPSVRPSVVRGIAAHELNHVHHFSLDWRQELWLFESTATAAEDPFAPGMNSWVSYARRWGAVPELPLDDASKRYGSGAFLLWLARRHGPSVLRDVWVGSPQAGFSAFRALDRAIPGGLAAAFSAFAAETAEWRRPAMDLPDAALLTDARRAGALTAAAPDAVAVLDHGSHALFDVARPEVPGPLALEGGLPDGVAGAIALVGRSGGSADGAATVALAKLPDGGAGTVRLDRPQDFARITAVLVDAGFERGEAGYRGDGLRLAARVVYPPAARDALTTPWVAPVPAPAAGSSPAATGPLTMRLRMTRRIGARTLRRRGVRLAIALNRDARVAAVLRSGRRVVGRSRRGRPGTAMALRLRVRPGCQLRRLSVTAAATDAAGERVTARRRLAVRQGSPPGPP